MTAVPHTPVNILLVDDQPAKLLTYEVMLSELGENLIRAESGREALDILLTSDVAVVLVDVCMPELDGFDLAQMLREHPRFERTAIIFVSAVQMSDEDRIKGYASGAVDYVPVPVVPEILRAKVSIFVELYRKTRELEAINEELEYRVQQRTLALSQSAERLRESEERLRLASDAAGFGTYDYHPDTDDIYWSRFLRDLAGIPGDGPIPLSEALAFAHPENRRALRDHISGHQPGSGRREIEFRLVRPGGEVRWLLDRGQTIVDPHDPSRLRVMGTVLDITQRKQAEEHQRVLTLELEHRVKNILANVSAIARLSSRTATTVDQFVDVMDSRIEAMARAHDLLRQASWGTVALAELIGQTLAPFQSGDGRTLRISGPPVRILPQYTQPLALILQELATNASKYGAWTRPEGAVTLSWQRTGKRSGTLRIEWVESGGPRVTPPARKGFGMEFLTFAISAPGATACSELLPEGMRYTLEGPLEQEGSAAPTALQDAPPKQQDAPQRGTPRLRILVVEDEPLVGLQLRADLEDAEHDVIGPAQTLGQGLELSRGDVDLALLDYSLGSETSVPIAEWLSSRGIPFALATGYSDPASIPESLRHIPRLRKPYNPKDVLKMVETLRAATLLA